ncbi:tripartite tricarboxylate transporter substrate binding protein BugD [Acidovorax sp. sif1233]|uniref:tripartite tricarboxylate transporter substrate-binding protein n=1 Tax=Acidovorax sp. sif1233 TaxID=2854792 RepID=UPI001C45738F|nr:tripartite tricarboxylate transporter substrate-binding protein [Acidovorax sp. sif1233]MBV7453570.1 tripartite tricarboxylate transporter substrate binding protein BugD [Acidovorax sp. sif1233]
MRNQTKTLLAAALALASTAVAAFPTKPVTIVVPYAAGGSTDVLARVLAEAMARDLGQPVIVDSAGGAGGTIGTAKVVRAPNDGHTVLLHNMGIATAPALYSKLAFDVNKDLEPIALAGEVPMILVRYKNFAPATVAELIQHMKARPGEVKFSHAGVGATSHLCAMLFNQTAGTTVTMVPYRGTGPALQDLVAGNVDLICDQPVATGPHLQSGALKAYAMATRERIPTMPEVPTFAESGLPGFELAVWHGVYAPKGTPLAVVERLNKAVRGALADAGLVKRFTDMGVIIPQGDRLKPEALRQQTAAEIRRWDPVIKAAGAKAE